MKLLLFGIRIVEEDEVVDIETNLDGVSGRAGGSIVVKYAI